MLCRRRIGSLLLALTGLLWLGLTLSGCDRSQEKPATAVSARPSRCLDCHQGLRPDPAHNLGCPTCHLGREPASNKAAAHQGMVAHPAHPQRMARTCGRCHAAEATAVASSSHFTLKNAVNLVRRAFGANEDLASAVEIPVTATISSPLDLVDDALRRRCLRCHPYSPGDPYPETRHGTGCAACHLEYGDGALLSHRFTRLPSDRQCLHCHNGNRVGADYYGRFQHDFSIEFRTPYKADGSSSRPYGVEDHQLRPDLHQQAGLACIDCHPGSQLMTGSGRPVTRCRTCHGWRPGQPPGLSNLSVANGRLVLTTRQRGQRLLVPQPRHPAHREHPKTDCVVCHAQWTYNDQGTNLLRLDDNDFEPWWMLTVQGSYEVEEQLEAGLYGDSDQPPLMRDTFTGKLKPGLWLKGFVLRRWAHPLVGRDAGGTLRLYRPMLDISLSMVNQEGKVPFDAIRSLAPRRGLLPYTPHTIGKAGAFYRQRLEPTIPRETTP